MTATSTHLTQADESGDAYSAFLSWLDPDPHAAHESYLRLGRRLQAYFHHRWPGEAEDLSAETLLAAAQNFKSQTRDSYPSADPYVFGIARNLGRREARRPPVFSFGHFGPELSPVARDESDQFEETIRLRQCLQRLPVDDRVTLFRYYQAVRDGSPKPGDLRVKVHRIKLRLRALLEDEACALQGCRAV